MDAELPPFKNGEHNPERGSTINCVITPVKWFIPVQNPNLSAFQHFQNERRQLRDNLSTIVQMASLVVFPLQIDLGEGAA